MQEIIGNVVGVGKAAAGVGKEIIGKAAAGVGANTQHGDGGGNNRNGIVGAGGHDSPRGNRPRAGAEDGGIFAMASNNRLFGSGAFFALKVQAAKNKKQLEEFAIEVDNFRKLQGSENAEATRNNRNSGNRQ